MALYRHTNAIDRSLERMRTLYSSDRRLSVSRNKNLMSLSGSCKPKQMLCVASDPRVSVLIARCHTVVLSESPGFAGIFRLIRVQKDRRREARRFLITMEDVMSHLAKRFARVLLTAIVASAALGSQFAALWKSVTKHRIFHWLLQTAAPTAFPSFWVKSRGDCLLSQSLYRRLNYAM